MPRPTPRGSRRKRAAGNLSRVLDYTVHSPGIGTSQTADNPFIPRCRGHTGSYLGISRQDGHSRHLQCPPRKGRGVNKVARMRRKALTINRRTRDDTSSTTVSTSLDAVQQTSPPSSRPSSSQHIKRSLTGLTSPGKLHRRQLSKSQAYQHEDREKPPSSSALRATHAHKSLDNTASTGTRSFMSSSGSRRTSIPAHSENGCLEESKLEKEARLLLEQGQASLRTDGLKQSLLDLNSFSTTMTKRLDDTYYSVLERMSTLERTITSLQGLAQTSHDICNTFDKQARDLESDIIRQLSAAGRFDEKQARIAGLQKRIHEARDKIAALASRVDEVQRAVERWEQADKRWQERTRKRLKIIWSATTVFALIVLALVIGVKYASGGNESDSNSGSGSGSGIGSSGVGGGGVGEVVASVGDWQMGMSPNVPPWLSARRNESAGKVLWKTPVRDAERLRAFDEL
ncbi:hypothetical protein E4U56_007747 [Claviceps arundinis]|uniref:Uncharacterized protein n=1 Tax=Claviceps arundinis TaxID=1623583 RepID=A0A9P7MZV8_9HYPO|nr:hypothetical protein E4U56_007747 [Claviceps arundinis]